MSIELSSSLPQTTPAAHLRTRVAAIGMLGATAAALLWVAINVFYICTDSWVAPIRLSPDSDKVIQLRLQLDRQLSDLARVEAEVARIDGDVEAIDAAVERLTGMRGQSRDSMTWQAGVRGEEVRRLGRVIDNLRRQHELLDRLQRRQAEVTGEARGDLEAGLVDRDEVRRQEQSLDALELSIAENARQLEEAEMRKREADVASQGFRAGIGERDRGRDLPRGQMPEVAAGEEHELRLELELIQLQSERRGLAATRAAAADRLADERALLGELQTRPLYRAMHASTDVAFVPYDQMDGVEPGARVLSCTWGLFACKDVGRVAEVLPGEVATEDPWGDLARGQFAILELDDPDAVRDKVLRVRGR